MATKEEVAKIRSIVQGIEEARQAKQSGDRPRTNENGDLVVNKFDEQTTLTTEGIKFYTYEKDFSQFEDLSLYVMSDTHFACEESQIEKVRRYLEQVLKTPNGVLVLNGDIINFAIKDSVSEAYEANMSIKKSIETVQKMVESLDKQGRIILNLWGNHDGNRSHKLVDVTPVETYVKDKEKTAPAVAVVKLKLKSKFKENETVNLTLMFQHGEAAKGGALGTVQSAINLAIDLYNAIPDFVFMGHTHQSAGSSALVFMPDVNSEKAQRALKQRKKVETVKKRIGGFAVPAAITTEVYAMKKGYPLSNTDGVMFEFQQVKDKDKTTWDSNMVDMDLLYAIENMPNSKQKRQLERAYKFLIKEEHKYHELLKELAVEQKVKAYQEYTNKNDELIVDVMNQYGVSEDDLHKHLEKR